MTLAAYPLVPRQEVGFRAQITAANTEEQVDRLVEALAELARRELLQRRIRARAPGGGVTRSSSPRVEALIDVVSRRAALWQGYLACAAVGMCLYLFVPPIKGNPVLLNSIGLTTWIAVFVGIKRNRPSYRLPWLLIGVGFLLYWIGDVYTYSYPRLILHHEVPFPSFGDAMYLAVYPLQMLGLLLLVRRRNPRRDRNTLIDAAILTLGLSLLSWVLQIAPYVHESSMALLPKLVSIAYPLGDILMLAAAIRLLLERGRRGTSFYLLSASLVSLLVTDFTYGILTLDGSFHHQLILDLGWTSYSVLWATAALHPSMASMHEPADGRREAKLTPLRLTLLHGRLPDRPGLHPAEGGAARRPRPDRDHLRLDRAVRLRRDAHGRPRSPAGAFGRARSNSQLLRRCARRVRDTRRDREGRDRGCGPSARGLGHGGPVPARGRLAEGCRAQR